jgi:uncharacterized repeat protein (TIGR04138 family)
LDPLHQIIQLARQDRRYRPEAYFFVLEALDYAQQTLKLGGEGSGPAARADRHLTGQQLCEAMRLYALDQFGLMAKCVLNSWGLTVTGDFGEIVYNMIRIERMRKTDEDRREDFDDVFDFETGLGQSFQFSPADER